MRAFINTSHTEKKCSTFVPSFSCSDLWIRVVLLGCLGDDSVLLDDVHGGSNLRHMSTSVPLTLASSSSTDMYISMRCEARQYCALKESSVERGRLRQFVGWVLRQGSFTAVHFPSNGRHVRSAPGDLSRFDPFIAKNLKIWRCEPFFLPILV